MKRMARVTALWYGSFDDDLLHAIRKFADTRRIDEPPQLFEEVLLTDMLASAIVQLFDTEPARAVRLLVQIGNTLEEGDARIYQMLLLAVHQKGNLLTRAVFMTGNDEARYLLATILLLCTRLVISQDDHLVLAKFSKEPWEHYKWKNGVLFSAMDKALAYLSSPAVGDVHTKDTYQEAVARAIFGPVWAELYAGNVLLMEDILRDVLQQKPPFHYIHKTPAPLGFINRFTE